MRDAPTNSDDVIDSRDVIARIEELTAERDALAEDATETGATADLDEWDEENAAELASLKVLAAEGEGCASDWIHGATLIRESYFEDYCRELVVDIGDLPNDIPGYLAIDWAKTANNLRVDYAEVEFDGVTYLVR